jgi:hypothetical protein
MATICRSNLILVLVVLGGGAPENVGDLSCGPSPAARRRYPARVQGVGDLPQARALGPQRLDDRQDVRGELIGGGPVAGEGPFADLVQTRVAESDASRFGARERLLRAGRYLFAIPDDLGSYGDPGLPLPI